MTVSDDAAAFAETASSPETSSIRFVSAAWERMMMLVLVLVLELA